MIAIDKKKSSFTLVVDKESQEYKEWLSALVENKGFCPCKISKEADDLCHCEEIKGSEVGTTCFCGIFKKVGEN